MAEGSLQARLLDMYRWGKAHGWRAPLNPRPNPLPNPQSEL